MFETRSEQLKRVANAWNLERARIKKIFFNGVFNHSEREDSAATREMRRLAAKFGTKHIYVVSIMGVGYLNVFQGREVHHLSASEIMERSRRDHELVSERAIRTIVTSLIADGYEHLIVSTPLQIVSEIYGMEWAFPGVVTTLWNGFKSGKATGWANLNGRRVSATLSWSCA